MTLEFREVTDENFNEFIELEVHEKQRNSFYFKRTKPNLWSLAQLHIHEGSKIVAIYAGGMLVGSMFYNSNTAPLGEGNKAWLTRFMIDKRYQKRGYGRQAMLMLFERVKAENGSETVSLGLSYEPENKVAEELYRSLGFEGSGEIMEGQIVVWKEL